MSEINKRENEPQKELTKPEAQMHVNAVWQQMAVYGNIDRERDIVTDILRRLESNEISPQEAVRRVNELEASKNER